MKTTKKEIFEMIYQFVGAGIIFWLVVLTSLEKGITARVIYPLYFSDGGMLLGNFFMYGIITIGVIVLMCRGAR